MIEPQVEQEQGNPQQQTFDHLLAKAMKLIYNDKINAQLIKTIKTGEPVQAIGNIVLTVIEKLETSAAKSNKQIPQEMLPDLALSLIAQLVELVNADGEIQIDEKKQSLIFSYAVQEYMKKGIASGKITQEEAQQALESLKQKQTETAPQQAQQAQPVTQPQQVPQQQPTGGLLT